MINSSSQHPLNESIATDTTADSVSTTTSSSSSANLGEHVIEEVPTILERWEKDIKFLDEKHHKFLKLYERNRNIENEEKTTDLAREEINKRIFRVKRVLQDLTKESSTDKYIKLKETAKVLLQFINTTKKTLSLETQSGEAPFQYRIEHKEKSLTDALEKLSLTDDQIIKEYYSNQDFFSTKENITMQELLQQERQELFQESLETIIEEGGKALDDIERYIERLRESELTQITSNTSRLQHVIHHEKKPEMTIQKKAENDQGILSAISPEAPLSDLEKLSLKNPSSQKKATFSTDGNIETIRFIPTRNELIWDKNFEKIKEELEKIEAFQESSTTSSDATAQHHETLTTLSQSTQTILTLLTEKPELQTQENLTELIFQLERVINIVRNRANLLPSNESTIVLNSLTRYENELQSQHQVVTNSDTQIENHLRNQPESDDLAITEETGLEEVLQKVNTFRSTLNSNATKEICSIGNRLLKKIETILSNRYNQAHCVATLRQLEATANSPFLEKEHLLPYLFYLQEVVEYHESLILDETTKSQEVLNSLNYIGIGLEQVLSMVDSTEEEIFNYLYPERQGDFRDNLLEEDKNEFFQEQLQSILEEGIQLLRILENLKT